MTNAGGGEAEGVSERKQCVEGGSRGDGRASGAQGEGQLWQEHTSSLAWEGEEEEEVRWVVAKGGP